MYYPLNKITPGLYTAGNEFIIKSTQLQYKGFYYSTYDGKFFTGKSPNAQSIELTKASAQLNRTPAYAPKHSSPIIQDSDKQQGYLTRYFIKRVNGGVDTILEVSVDDYNITKGQVLYNTTQLQWKISGPLYDTKDNNGNPVSGVVDTNTRTLLLKEKELPGISQYLFNLTQFFTGTV